MKTEYGSGASRVLAGAVAISFAAIFVPLAGVPSAVAAFYRVLIGGAVLLLVAVVRRERLQIEPRFAVLVVLAGLAFAFDLVLWHLSIYRVGPGIATLLPNFQVVLMALAGWLFWRERLTWALAAGIGLALAGLVMLVAAAPGSSGPGFLAGIGFGLGAAVAYTAYLVFLRHAGRQASRTAPALFMGLVSLATAALLAIWLVVTRAGFAVAPVSAWLWLALYGVACQAAGWFLISTGLPRVPAATAGLLLLLQPTLTFVWDHLIFGRRFTPFELGGAVLAIVSIFWVRYVSSHHDKRIA